MEERDGENLQNCSSWRSDSAASEVDVLDQRNRLHLAKEEDLSAETELRNERAVTNSVRLRPPALAERSARPALLCWPRLPDERTFVAGSLQTVNEDSEILMMQ